MFHSIYMPKSDLNNPILLQKILLNYTKFPPSEESYSNMHFFQEIILHIEVFTFNSGQLYI